MLDETLILILAAGAACIVFFAGLCTVAASLYLFMKQRSRTVGKVPAWALVLATGLFLTFVVPGIIVFIAAYIIATQTPPPVVTCYVPVPPDYPAGAVVDRAGLVEKLRGQGKIPEEVYEKLRGSR